MNPLRVSLLLAFALVAGCGQGPEERPPWKVERLPGGGTEVLGLRPGTSTMADVLARHGRQVEAALFESKSGELAVEAHYGSVRVAGISGRLILSLDLGTESLAALRRASPNYIFLEGGRKRHELAASFSDVLLDERVRVVTFVPEAALDEETLRARFGAPDERVATAGGVHLLYPDIGTDVLLQAEEEAIIQYVHPRDFGWLREAQGI